MNQQYSPYDTLAQAYRDTGLAVVDEFMDVTALLMSAQKLNATHSLPLIGRQMPGRSLRYRVMDGDFVFDNLPMLFDLGEKILALIKRWDGRNLCSLDNRVAAVNVNITDPGGEYRWHYDRNAVTAILYLNAVEGGETELLPNSRTHLGPFKATALQRLFDERQIKRAISGSAGDVKTVAPKSGRLLVMRGDCCLHSVAPVLGSTPRYNVIFTYDQQGKEFAVDRNLDPYLYSTDKAQVSDPNYVA